LASSRDGNSPEAKSSLADIPVPVAAWEGQLALALERLLADPPREFHVFRNVLGYSIAHGADRRALRAEPRSLDFGSMAQQFPLATTFIKTYAVPEGAGFGAGHQLKKTLGWLILELHLSGGVHRKEVETLAGQVRNMVRTASSSQLLRTIAECDGLGHLVRKMEELEVGRDSVSELTGHGQFDHLWRSFLAGTCLRLLGRFRRDETTEEDAEHSPLGARDLAPLDPLGTSAPDQPDDDAGMEDELRRPAASLTEGYAGRLLRMTAELYRRSSPDLLRDPDAVAPTDLLERQWTFLLTAALRASRENDLAGMQSCLIHLLAIEAGLTDAEAQRAVFHHCALPDVPAIDVQAGLLRRSEVRPAGAWVPKRELEAWAPTGGDAPFPLSRGTVACARALLRLKKRCHVRPTVSLVDSEEIVRPVRDAWRVSRLRTGMTPARYRQRLAAGLSESLGQDAAQIAFGDSFGTNVAPTYYASFRAEELSDCLADLNGKFVPEKWRWRRPADGLVHRLGSKARPNDSPFSCAWAIFGFDPPPKRGRPSQQDELERWTKRRDSLALHIALATGHRPTRALAGIRLHDFLPAHALVVLSDKQTDPAHLTRLASTGKNFISSLSSFVKELERIARQSAERPSRQLASRILSGEAALFDVPGAANAVVPLNVTKLFASLPGTWGVLHNLHRHALCQYLIDAGIDPEMRYFQMGWQVHDVHAVSEIGPRPPAEITASLAGVIDTWVENSGWLGGARAPQPALKLQGVLADWHLRHEAQQDAGRSQQRRLEQSLRSARSKARAGVLERLAMQLPQVIPRLVLVTAPHTALKPRASDPGGQPVAVRKDQIAALIEPFDTPLELYVAKVELRRLLARAMRAGYCTGPLPSVRTLIRRQTVSPFLRGAGLAAEHAKVLRERLEQACGSVRALDLEERWERLAMLAFWSIAAFSPYRSLAQARAIVWGAADACRGKVASSILRVPIGDRHAVVSGMPALLLVRLQSIPEAADSLRSLSTAEPARLGKVLLELLPEETTGLSPDIACSRMESTLLAAGDYELSGPERLVMRAATSLGTVSSMRATACLDDCRISDQMPGDGADESDPVVTRSNPPHRPKTSISKLMRFFDPDYDGDINGHPALPAGRRGRQLVPLVRDQLERFPKTPTYNVVLLDYILRALIEGGPRSSGGMAISTIYKIFHRLRPALAALDEDADMTLLGSDVLTGAIVASFGRARRKDHRGVLDDIRQFFRFAKEIYGVEEPDWGMLAMTAGCRVESDDPAVIGDCEIGLMLEELASAVTQDALEALDPTERRFREVQFAAALLAEASGARPASIHGLTLGDVYLSSDQDFIHLHASGLFGSIKTQTSAGFVSLEGCYWKRYFPWFSRWLGALCRRHSSEDLVNVPLFQVPGTALSTRYPKGDVFGRIGLLVRWATQQTRGRSYWLRKRRVGLRFKAAAMASAPHARDVVRAMRASGHANIRTPLAAYLGDPLSYMRLAASLPPLGGAPNWAAVTGMTSTAVEQRWLRRHRALDNAQSLDPQIKVAALLGPSTQFASPPEHSPPPQAQYYRRDFSWSAVGEVLGLIAEGLPDTHVAAASWVSEAKVAAVREGAADFTRRSGTNFGEHGLRPPRPTTFATHLAKLIGEQDGRLACVAREWATACRASSDAACAVYDDATASALTSILREEGLGASWSRLANGPALCKPIDDHNRVPYGAISALHWALAVVWVATEPNHNPLVTGRG